MKKSQMAVSALHLARNVTNSSRSRSPSLPRECRSSEGEWEPHPPNARTPAQAAAPARQMLLRHSGTFERADSWRLRCAARPRPGKHLSSCRDTDMRHKACQISFTPTSQPSSSQPILLRTTPPPATSVTPSVSLVCRYGMSDL